MLIVIKLLTFNSLIDLIQQLDLYDLIILKQPIWKTDKNRDKNSLQFQLYLVLFVAFRLTLQFIFFRISDKNNVLELVVQTYMVAPLNLTNFLFVYFCHAIKLRFELLNDTLYNLIKISEFHLLSDSLEKIRLLHLQLIKCIQFLNLSFGRSMSTLYFIILANGLRIIFNISYFFEYSSLHYIFYFLWNIIAVTVTVITSDCMLTQVNKII